MVVRDTLQFQHHLTYADPQGRYLLLVCTITQTTYTLLNVYGPNTRQLHFYKRLKKKIESLKQGNIIIGGKFNIIRDPDMAVSTKHSHSRPCLNPFLQASDLFDVWRCQHGSYSHIDFFLVDKWTLQNVVPSDISLIT